MKRFLAGIVRTGRICRRQSVAVVRQQGQIVAFANLLSTQMKSEASVDLMRQLPLAPPGTMDFLFTKLMLLFSGARAISASVWAWRRMSGMASHELAPRWHRFGRMLFDSWRDVLQLPRPARLQRQVRSGVGAALPGRGRRADAPAHTR